MVTQQTRHRPRLRGRRFPAALPLVVASLAAAGVLTTPLLAEASVTGRQGIEIEGPRDRRGFFISPGLAFGGTFFYVDEFIAATRVNLALGGGVTKRFTLGVNLHLTPFFKKDTGVAFGGDIEGTGYVWRGLYLRVGLGAAGVPKRDKPETTDEDEKGLAAGLGGAAEAGYEFWLNQSAAMGVGLTYDLRFIPGTKFPRQGLFIGARFSWF